MSLLKYEIFTLTLSELSRRLATIPKATIK